MVAVFDDDDDDDDDAVVMDVVMVGLDCEDMEIDLQISCIG